MRALFVTDSAAPARSASRFIEAEMLQADALSPLCEVMVAGQVMSAVYDSGRKTLLRPCPPSAKLSEQPEDVSAVICSCYPSAGYSLEYMALLAAGNGATILLPREGAANASEIRVRPRPVSDKAPGANGVAMARGPDPYAAVLEATRILAEQTGAQHKDVYAYALPLLDAVNRLKFDAPLVAAKSNAKASSSVSLSSLLEQQLHEGILVQAGLGCPAKPLLQAPGLRVCQGMSAPLGVRYSGMSVVYGTATGHVLAVMDTASALKMAPVGGLVRPLGPSLSDRVSGDAESPSAVSAVVSTATSASPSPRMSRSNSGDAVTTADVVASLVIRPSGVNTRTPPVVLSGRSITAAPIIQILAAPAPGGGAAAGLVSYTPTGAPAHALASFALLGFKVSAGRLGVVQCCRVMPAAAAASRNNEEPAAAASAGRTPGLGVVLQVEVSCASAGTVLLFVEGPELEPEFADLSEEDLAWDEEAATGGPVRSVLTQGRAARWRYNATGGILSVELPPAATDGVREVQVFL